MLAGIEAYRVEIGQGDLDFNLKGKELRENNDAKKMRKAWDTFYKQFEKFAKVADFRHADIVTSKNREIDTEIKPLASSMMSIAKKLQADCLAYQTQTQKKVAVAKAA